MSKVKYDSILGALRQADTTSMHIFNGQELPEGAEPDVLFIDTGIVDWDISNETGTSLEIIVPDGYSFSRLFANSIDESANGELLSTNSDGEFPLTGPIYLRGSTIVVSNQSPNNTSYYTEDNVKLSYTIVDSNLRVILVFNRSEHLHPIPVPHIISAEMENSQSFIGVHFIFDSPMKEVLDASNIGFKFNGIPNYTGGIGFGSNPNGLDISFNDVPAFGDEITFYSTSLLIKNTWGGILPEVIDLPIVNTIPDPTAHLISAQTDEYGERVVFTSDMDFIQNSNVEKIVKINGLEIPDTDFLLSVVEGILLLDLNNGNAFMHGDILSISIPSETVQTTLGGYLEAVIDFPITNNVPA